MNALLICLTLLCAAPRTTLEEDVAALGVATQRFEDARAAMAAAETNLATRQVLLRGARAALYAAIRRVQEDLAGIDPPAPRPVLYTQPTPARPAAVAAPPKPAPGYYYGPVHDVPGCSCTGPCPVYYYPSTTQGSWR